MPSSGAEVRFQGQTGKHFLVLSITGFDPTETWAAQDFRKQQDYSFLC
jgi:hypothetical protein